MWQFERICVILIIANLLLSSSHALIFADVGALIAQANIYYQKSAAKGEPFELPIQQIHELPTKDTLKLIIHGYVGSRTHISIAPLGNTYLAQGAPNILLADWSDAAGLDYVSSRRAVGEVALHFAQLLNDFLIRHDLERSAVHVIGHSLGAHIAGGVGAYFNGTLGRVTGLDPALPLFMPYSADGLSASAAQFVDVIHTDYPAFGDLTPRGTADFYVNYGYLVQPGCDDIDLPTISKLIFNKYSCSHNRAVILYAESIVMPKNFPSLPCSFDAIRVKNSELCWDNLPNYDLSRAELDVAIAHMDEEHVVYMGEAAPTSATGSYFLETYAVPPFGIGLNTRFSQ